MTNNYQVLDVPNFNYVPYQSTNESVDSIAAGLNLKYTDRVLTICGSLDQARKILGLAGKVLAIDKDPRQVRFAQVRLDALIRGDYAYFDNPSRNVVLRIIKNLFFNNKDLSALREKVIKGTIRVSQGDVFSFSGEVFDKAYLSNVITYSLSHDSPSFASRLDSVASLVVPGGLVYISDYEKAKRYAERLRQEDFSTPRLVLDKELTVAARKANKEALWTPAVYRKVGESSK